MKLFQLLHHHKINPYYTNTNILILFVSYDNIISIFVTQILKIEIFLHDKYKILIELLNSNGN